MTGGKKRRWPWVVLVLALAAGGAALAVLLAPEPATGRLWFVVEERDGELSSQVLDTEDYYGALEAGALLEALLAGPESAGLESPFLAGVEVLSWSQDQAGVLTVDLSEEYGGLSGVGLTLADSCITLTLCQLSGVGQVRILVEGEELAYRSKQIFSPDDVLFSGDEEASVEVEVTLVFPLAEGSGLGWEERTVAVTEETPLPQAVLAALLAGPESETLRPLAEGELTAPALRVDESTGICYLNFSRGWEEELPQEPEARRLFLYSLVNTLCELESIQKVQLLSAGDPIPSLGGVNTREPLEADWEL